MAATWLVHLAYPTCLVMWHQAKISPCSDKYLVFWVFEDFWTILLHWKNNEWNLPSTHAAAVPYTPAPARHWCSRHPVPAAWNSATLYLPKGHFCLPTQPSSNSLHGDSLLDHIICLFLDSVWSFLPSLVLLTLYELCTFHQPSWALKMETLQNVTYIWAYVSQGSSASIVSDYGLDSWVIKAWSLAEMRIFPPASVSRPALGPIQPPVQWVLGVKCSRGVTLTSHPPIQCRGPERVGTTCPVPPVPPSCV
jgi:hypothetical protein